MLPEEQDVFSDFKVDDWINSLNAYFGKGPRKIGRPFKKNINDDFIFELKLEGYTNRRISREFGYARRTVDYRVNKLIREGKLVKHGYKYFIHPDLRVQSETPKRL